VESEPPVPETEATVELLALVRSGNASARDRLIRRFYPVLAHWAHGRLPRGHRDLAETHDLVHIALIRALDQVGVFDPRREGAFLSYLRTILINLVRDEIRRSGRQPAKESMDDASILAAPVVAAVGSETLDAYEAALAVLPEAQREAVILRVEFGYSHQAIADAIGSPSANAARMYTARALVRVAREMERTLGRSSE
jgi:RNA polymerase sigma-70 factor (ECF subfamily)